MTLSNLRKIGAVSAICAGLGACVSAAPVSENICYRNPYFPDENHGLLIDYATETLADHGLTVTDAFVTNKTQRSQQRRSRILLPSEDEYIIGYNVWTHVEQCSQGQVVAEYGPDCNLKQIYTRYGCEVAGLP